MAKATIEALITAIGDGLANKAIKIRAAYTAFMNEFYSEIFVNKIDIFGNVVNNCIQKTIGNNNFYTYELFFNKKGNVVFINGYINFNIINSINLELFTIINNDYLPKSIITEQFISVRESNSLETINTIEYIKIINNKIQHSFTSPISSNRYLVNGFYFTND